MSSVNDSVAVPSGADTADIAKVSHLWQTKLEPAITAVLNTGKGLDFVAWTTLYTDVYNCCTTSPKVQCPDLYSRIAPFFEAYTAKIYADSPDDDALLVDYYDTHWDHFQQGSVLVDNLFAYLNRYYVRPERTTGRAGIVPVLDVALAQWKTQVFEPLLPRLEGAGLPLEAVRDGFALENLTPAKLKEMRIRAV
ncbi:Cullin repeat-like-containing domain protein [Mycena sanguinolenta]|nr:Cullin repeat-like-containing domain protein [Mycena sanguinolenta]